MIKILNSLLETILEVSLSTSLFFILILLLTKPINKHYSTKWRYLLYLILALRLIFLVNINIFESKVELNTNNISVPEIVHDIFFKTASDPNTTEDVFDNTKATYISSTKTFVSTVKSNLTLIYLSGLLIFLFTTFLRYITTYKSIIRWSLPLTDKLILNLENNLCDKLSIKTPIKILKCKAITTPMVMGLFKPQLFLPWKDYSEKNLELILTHELTHYKRKDIYYKLLLLIVNAVHWFNPLIYLMKKEANKNLELYCDDTVIKDKDKSFKELYSEIILDTMYDNVKGSFMLTTHFSGGVNSMKKRFLNIFSKNKKHTGLISLVAILLTVFISSSLIGCNINSSKSSPEDTAKSFIKTMFEVKNYDSVDKLEALYKKFDSDKAKYYKSDSTGNGLTQSDVGTNEVRDLVYGDLKPLITNDFYNNYNLIADRTHPIAYSMMAKASKYLSAIEIIDLQEISSKDTSKTFTYSASLKLTYEDGSEKTQKFVGSIDLLKENDSWLVNGFRVASMTNN